MSTTAYPTEFPADAAVRIGRAVLAKSFTADLLEDAWLLQGYLQGRLFPSSGPRPVLAASLPRELETDEAIAAELLRVAEVAQASEPGARAIGVILPSLWTCAVILQMVVRLIAEAVKRDD